MTAVFSHGRLRLYLLKLLAEGPRHGYELIRLLENRFLGMYVPSAGTIYPRLARMASEGLVTQRAAGGRKVYEITEAGRAELVERADELAALEGDIHAEVADLTSLATEIEAHVSGAARDIKRELRDAAARERAARPAGSARRFARESWTAEDPIGETGSSRPPRAGAAALERATASLAAEVHRLARAPELGDESLAEATAVVTDAVTRLRTLV